MGFDMNRTTLKLCFSFSLLMVAAGMAQQRSDYVSDASWVVGAYEPGESEYSVADQVAKTDALIALLDEGQKEKLLHELKSDERQAWTNLPAPRDAGGLRLGEMTEPQIKAACSMLATMLSSQGYKKAVNIMLADDQLLNEGKPRPGFGTENYAFVIFGTPSETEPWGVQFDGHHVAVNLAIRGESVCMSPSFIGTQPQTFELAGNSIRPLTREIDDSYLLISSLTDPQRRSAVTREQRGDLLTGPGNDFREIEAKGVSCSEFTEKQQGILFGLIAQWVNDLPPQHAEKRMEEIRSELDEMFFEWNGETEVGSNISYRIVSPSLIIEYACQGRGESAQQHLHTIYRDPTNEYGLQIGSPRR
jgi:hypothetical protein